MLTDWRAVDAAITGPGRVKLGVQDEVSIGMVVNSGGEAVEQYSSGSAMAFLDFDVSILSAATGAMLSDKCYFRIGGLGIGIDLT